MTNPDAATPIEPGAGPTLAELTERMARHIQSGQRVDVEDYSRRYPAWAPTLRRLLTTIRDLDALKRCLGGGIVLRGSLPNASQLIGTTDHGPGHSLEISS